jgi:hypothetical protein
MWQDIWAGRFLKPALCDKILVEEKSVSGVRYNNRTVAVQLVNPYEG